MHDRTASSSSCENVRTCWQGKADIFTLL